MQLLGVAGLWVSAMACGPSVVYLGTRGGGGAGSAVDAAAATGGTGGTSGDGAAGLGQIGSGVAGADAAALGGAGSEPVANDAGPAMPPDTGVPGPEPEPSTGCGMQPPAASDTSITVSGAISRYAVSLATGYDRSKPYPLVLSYHGANVSLAAFQRALDLPSVVGSDGIVVNVDYANGAGMWDPQRDPAVFEPLLAKLEASYCIDRRRIFVVGHETGAIFANVLACTHGDVLRGLGSISGVAPQGTCKGPLPVWISQGNSDMTRTLGRANREFWIGQNHCDGSMSTMVDPSPCLAYAGCEVGSPLHYCEYPGNQDVPSFAAAAVWNFFKGL